MTCARTDPWCIETASVCSCATCEAELAAWRTAHWLEAEAENTTAPWQRVHRSGRRRKIKELLLERTGGRCAICGDPCSLDWPTTHPAYATIDHIRPRSRGGEDTLSNWQIACLSCNQKKGDKWDETG